METEKRRLITFDGVPDGDGECFHWSGVDAEDCADLGQDPEISGPGRLTPNDLMGALGCEYGKRYRFVLSVSPMDEHFV